MSRPLSTKQKRFVDNFVLKQLSIAESVRRAGYNFKSGRSEDYGSYGCKLLKQERVASYVRKLRERAFEKQALSLAEKRAFLARALRSPVGELHEGSDLAQEVTVTEGKEGTVKRIKGVDKIRAIEVDNRMAGHDYKDREPQANNPFLFIVSLGKTPGIGEGIDALPMAKATVVDAETLPA